MSTDTQCPCCGTTERRFHADNVLPLDEPGELGYECPFCHKGNDLDADDNLTWSEWAAHLWCYACNRDIPTAQCPIRRPQWQSAEDFDRFIARLPFKAIVLDGKEGAR